MNKKMTDLTRAGWCGVRTLKGSADRDDCAVDPRAASESIASRARPPKPLALRKSHSLLLTVAARVSIWFRDISGLTQCEIADVCPFLAAYY